MPHLKVVKKLDKDKAKNRRKVKKTTPASEKKIEKKIKFKVKAKAPAKAKAPTKAKAPAKKMKFNVVKKLPAKPKKLVSDEKMARMQRKVAILNRKEVALNKKKARETGNTAKKLMEEKEEKRQIKVRDDAEKVRQAKKVGDIKVSSLNEEDLNFDNPFMYDDSDEMDNYFQSMAYRNDYTDFLTRKQSDFFQKHHVRGYDNIEFQEDADKFEKLETKLTDGISNSVYKSRNKAIREFKKKEKGTKKPSPLYKQSKMCRAFVYLKGVPIYFYFYI